jgi:hypothetical protein
LRFSWKSEVLQKLSDRVVDSDVFEGKPVDKVRENELVELRIDTEELADRLA